MGIEDDLAFIKGQMLLLMNRLSKIEDNIGEMMGKDRIEVRQDKEKRIKGTLDDARLTP